MKALVCMLLFALALQDVHSAMSEKQMKSAAKLIKNACQPKSKVSDEQIVNMHKGVWEEDPAAKCYMYCVLTMAKVAKKSGEFDREGAMDQIPTIPEKFQKPTEATLMACGEKVAPGADKCDSSWLLAKCMYFENPEYYFFP